MLLFTKLQTWYVTFVYGNPNVQGRIAFINQLKQMAMSVDIPWLVMGDFNICSSQADKWGNRGIHRSSAHAYLDFLFDYNLEEMSYSGQKYTWLNKQDGRAQVMERIDKALCNGEWRNLFSHSHLMHENLVASDHRPLILLQNKPSFIRKPFVFDIRCLESQDCFLAIRDKWDTSSNNFVKKLSECQLTVEVWCRDHLGNSRRRIEVLSKRLDKLLSSPSVNSIDQEIIAIRRQLQDLWELEEKYWFQKS